MKLSSPCLIGWLLAFFPPMPSLAKEDGGLRTQHRDQEQGHHPSPFRDHGSNFDLFNQEDRTKMAADITEAAAGASDSKFRLLQSDGSVSSRCGNDDACQDDEVCLAGRCVPDAENSCLANAMASFLEAFDADAWKASVYEEAGVTQDSLMQAALSAGGYKAFQESSTFQTLMRTGETMLPPQLADLQTAVSVCDSSRSEPLNGAVEGRAPSTQGTIVYLGLHFELSLIADIAASVFWTLGNGDWPTCFVRGTFGLEVGLGADASVLLGFAFSGTSEDILKGSIITDVDGGVGLGAGIAVVANLNGLVSLEFTLGVSLGGGLGVGYGITGPCCTDKDASSDDSPNGPQTNPVPSISVAPSGAPSLSQAPSAAPTCPALTLASERDIVTASVVGDLYNQITSAAGVFVTFNDPANPGNCATTPGNGVCTTQNAGSCTINSGSTTTISTLPVVSDFDATVAIALPGSCCDEFSCVFSLVETESFTATAAGQVVEIEYFATGGDDWYESALVLFRGTGPATLTTVVEDVLVVRGDELTSTVTDTFTVPSAGDYFLGFFTGSYDRTGGGGLGAALTIEAFRFCP